MQRIAWLGWRGEDFFNEWLEAQTGRFPIDMWVWWPKERSRTTGREVQEVPWVAEVIFVKRIGCAGAVMRSETDDETKNQVHLYTQII